MLVSHLKKLIYNSDSQADMWVVQNISKKTYLTLIAVRSCFVLSLARVDCWHSSSGLYHRGNRVGGSFHTEQ